MKSHRFVLSDRLLSSVFCPPFSVFRFRISVVCLLLFSSPCLFAGENPAASFFREAMDLKQKGSLVDAEAKLKKALELAPADPGLHFELANLYAMRHDARRKASAETDDIAGAAARELEQAVMLRPDFLAAHYNLGVVYKTQKKFEEAREEFRRVLELDPKQANAQMQIGSCYEQQGFFQEARDAYEKTKDLDFGNSGIQTAIDDLARAEEAAHERAASQSMASRLGRLSDRIPYSSRPFLATDAPPSGSGISQAVPYIGALLFQEFMKMRENSRNQ